MARHEYCSSRFWVDLQKDIVDSILARFTDLADYVRFGAVCSTWRRASLDPLNRNRRIESSLSSSSAPLLLLAPDYYRKPPDEDKPWKLTLFDLVRGNIIRKLVLTSSPITDFGKCFYGSTHGWLIFAGDEEEGRSLTLINPFYTGRGQGGNICRGGMISLPPLPLPERHYDDIGKVVLSADPASSPTDYMVFVIYGDAKQVLFIKSGDKYWELIKSRHRFTPRLEADDVVFHNRLVYAVDRKIGFYICDIDNGIVDPRFHFLCVAPPTPPDGPYPHCQCYIVPGPSPDGNSGELFLVYMPLAHIDAQARQFLVYKLLLAAGGGSPAAAAGGEWTDAWLEMNSLGNKAIILGQNLSVCIEICGHGVFQPNSIYFMNDNYDYLWQSGASTSQDVWVFNMDNQSIRKCYERGDLANGVKMLPPAWFFPSLPGNWKQVP